jgi:transglutaminase-like putative cysteine protease
MAGRFFTLFTLQFFLALPVISGEIRYPVWLIDSALLNNASMVVRAREVILEVKSLNSEVLKVHYTVTILNGSAAEKAVFMAFYDKYSSVDLFKGSMYDAAGNLIRNFNTKDIIDMSAIDNGILYSDDRVKVIRPVLGTFPVTLEFFSEITIKRILLYPAFKPIKDYDQSVEKASLEIIAKEECFPRFKELRLPGNTIITGDGKTSKKWEFKNLKSCREEPLSPPLSELAPVIYLNPTTYNVKGYNGDFTTWKSFGIWMKSLYEGRDSLPPAKAEQLRTLVQGITNREDKVRKIYSYLQQTTRYVAVDLGIGGLQPEKAEMVARLGYGDCKGLVNYTSAMLKCVGIPSSIILIRAGDNVEPIQRDFPGNQFNHVILCVPLEQDTVWLECTSQKAPFGFLGSFTNNRNALLVGSDGGILIHTPSYGKNDNIINKKTTLDIDSAGIASVQVNTLFRGLFYESVNDLLYLSFEKQKENLHERFSIPGMKILSFTSQSDEARIPAISESLSLSIPDFASLNGNRIFIPLTRLMDLPRNYSKDDTRSSDLFLQNRYIITDTLYINLPDGYHIESKPSACDFTTSFGSLKSSMEEQGSRVIFIRRFERENGVWPPSSYNEYIEFLKKVSKQDNKKLVLVRN